MYKTTSYSEQSVKSFYDIQVNYSALISKIIYFLVDFPNLLFMYIFYSVSFSKIFPRLCRQLQILYFLIAFLIRFLLISPIVPYHFLSKAHRRKQEGRLKWFHVIPKSCRILEIGQRFCLFKYVYMLQSFGPAITRQYLNRSQKTT